jgi:hypothetical protein
MSSAVLPGRRAAATQRYVSQTFSQPTGPGRLWTSLGAGASLLSDIISQVTESNYELKTSNSVTGVLTAPMDPLAAKVKPQYDTLATELRQATGASQR